MNKLKAPDPFHALVYRDGKRRGGIVRRQYEIWRAQQSPPQPVRCDNKECHFHTAPLVWNGRPLKLILDHQNGNNTDNRPTNLRFLCPACDSQLTETKGGANRGRIEKFSGGFAVVSKSGGKDIEVPIEPGRMTFEGQPIGVRIGPNKSRTIRSTRSRAKMRAPG